jgi:hypothetical protein
MFISRIAAALRRGRAREVREVNVYVSIDEYGNRSVNIYGGTVEQVAPLMVSALMYPFTPAAPVPVPQYEYPAFDGPDMGRGGELS